MEGKIEKGEKLGKIQRGNRDGEEREGETEGREGRSPKLREVCEMSDELGGGTSGEADTEVG